MQRVLLAWLTPLIESSHTKRLYVDFVQTFYGYRDHVIRMLFMFLNMWWSFKALQQLYNVSEASAAFAVFLYAFFILGAWSAFTGFLVVIYKKSYKLINILYANTLLLLLFSSFDYIVRYYTGLHEVSLYTIVISIVLVEWMWFLINTGKGNLNSYAKASVDLHIAKHEYERGSQETFVVKGE